MTYIVNVPNAAQSPFLLPSQNTENFTRLKAIISGDHVFNDTAAVDDGVHNQVTLVNRADPGSVPAGTNSMMYGKTASDTVNELWFYDAVTPRQLNWRELSGTVAISGTYAAVAAVPANTYGQILLYVDGITTINTIIQQGTFTSDGTGTNAYAYVEQINIATPILIFGNTSISASTSGFNIMAKNNSGLSSLNTTWTYKIYYRLK